MAVDAILFHVETEHQGFQKQPQGLGLPGCEQTIALADEADADTVFVVSQDMSTLYFNRASGLKNPIPFFLVFVRGGERLSSG